MKKTVKILSVLLIAMIVLNTTPVFGAAALIDSIDSSASIDASKTGNLAKTASDVVGFIRTVAVIAGVIILTVLGVKYMLGSAEEKAEYKKSLMPLVIGIIVVMASAQIATMIFNFVS